ncbi:prepilin-type N-terminal cleavage/methylation domain-containing protein [Jeongeupia sp. USM3]|uniref:prepilin-type N-terminal cleavage/methylation domain-containing protein n=1 Tax=Jeongeupia sp. USM3 TaxID=1906741 RepID=UPI00089DDC3F|nr:prepilin-type N-terminal cleavage/methylation domain-containing protein [Jeongeupia sp. USM3]AOY01294.1 hypothetical protein BJP62_13050 [Jeongeupia sp. USM3]
MKQRGFTLVELAIVLVIVGLILGLAFKGRDLIDGARVKSAQASANKIQAAVNIFFERYQFYPGDGCPAGVAQPAQCNGARNGLINGADEIAAFWTLLINTAILTNAERTTPFGTQWGVAAGANGVGGTTTNISYLTSGPATNTAATDIRYVCALDSQYDDGVPNAGNIRSSAAVGVAVNQYQANADCWSKTGQVGLSIRILP